MCKCGFLVFCLFVISPLKAQGKEQPKPNFIIFLTDDQRWDDMSCAGNPIIKTPNMDRIAAKGILFRNSFVTHSLCTPSRATLLSGKYSHSNGVISNEEIDVPGISAGWREQPLFVDYLRDAGYQTCYIGKAHDGSKIIKNHFDYYLGFDGQGTYNEMKLPDFDGKAKKEKGHTTDRIGQRALTYLSKHRKGPFCLIVGFKAPHIPYQPASRFKNLYKDVDFIKPDSWNISTKNKSKAVNNASFAKDMNFVRSRYQMLAGVDEAVGGVLDYLVKENLAKDTMVIHTSDNGFFHGEFRLRNKRLMYEPSIRIPMLLSYPRLIPQNIKRDEMVLLMDIAPTLLDFAGVKIPSDMHGKSWKPFLMGEAKEFRQDFYYAYYQQMNKPQFKAPASRGIRTEKWKLIEYPILSKWSDTDDSQSEYELYNLQEDPAELKNLALNPEYSDKIDKLKKRMFELRVLNRDPSAKKTR